jgi:DNA ligase-1
MSDRREFVMLAHPYKSKKHNIKGWLASEKMDGIRALWDGGISRGLYKSEVPWANTDKDERYIEEPVATGLWTRYGNVLHAPDWFLDQLPDYPLDGEMFADRKSWQLLSSTIKRLVPDHNAWRRVSYNVFEVPPYQQIFATGLVNNPNYIKQFDLQELMNWARDRFKVQPRFLDFATVTKFLHQEYGAGQFENIRPVVQTLVESEQQMDELFNEVLDLGGEGLIIRNPKSYWEPKRSHQQVKIKADEDDEGTVTGYIWGRETDKGSKLLGMMGALILDYHGKRFELSGFTNPEREMTFHPAPRTDPEWYKSPSGIAAAQEGELFPGKDVSRDWFNPSFPIGTRVTFKYRELSDDGIPKEGRYHRKRDSE